ncbi:protein of unassigned function [Methylobacterium oryzae CBMB20]|uniref:Protein of unassigned function n=1 Tax=Methylobacterium oryzae CBMB20 TaxID=693986 RepID=A0A089NYG9_9HYPH|nr:protein of unassigned function [Methylobacterium oryzae CBMB20]
MGTTRHKPEDVVAKLRQACSRSLSNGRAWRLSVRGSCPVRLGAWGA